jgi:hypothetical protein
VEEGEGLKEREWRLNQELTIELPGFPGGFTFEIL